MKARAPAGSASARQHGARVVGARCAHCRGRVADARARRREPLMNGSQPMKPTSRCAAPGPRGARRRRSRSPATGPDVRGIAWPGSSPQSNAPAAGGVMRQRCSPASSDARARRRAACGRGGGRRSAGNSGAVLAQRGQHRRPVWHGPAKRGLRQAPSAGPRPGRSFPRRSRRRCRAAAEVAVGRGAGVDRPVEAQVLADGARRAAADQLRQRPSPAWPGRSRRCRAGRHRTDSGWATPIA